MIRRKTFVTTDFFIISPILPGYQTNRKSKFIQAIPTGFELISRLVKHPITASRLLSYLFIGEKK